MARSRTGGRTGKGTEWVTEGDGQRERKQKGNGEEGDGWERGGQRGSEAKRSPLVGSAAEYQEAYRGGNAD